jgi:hypothetical protein
LLASATCKANIARAKELIATPLPSIDPSTEQDDPDVTAGTVRRHFEDDWPTAEPVVRRLAAGGGSLERTRLLGFGEIPC